MNHGAHKKDLGCQSIRETANNGAIFGKVTEARLSILQILAAMSFGFDTVFQIQWSTSQLFYLLG
jgi:hypothetical protein